MSNLTEFPSPADRETVMSTEGTLPAALAFVPNWWHETTHEAAIGNLLVDWARVCNWQACGFVWPGDHGVPVIRTVQAGSLVDVPQPVEVPDALRRIKQGEATVLYSTPGTGGRVFAGVQPGGRTLGLLWAERALGEYWTEAERAYVGLTAKVMERSPAVIAAIGPVVNPDKLNERLGDAAVIAGRMAHDFDNILTGIIGFADLTQPMLPAGSQAANFVAEISKVGQRGIQFTQQLHQLSRSGQVKPNPSSLAAAITKEEARLRSAMHSALRIEKELLPTLPMVAIEAAPLQVVIGHLLENAVEACPQGGIIRIAARPVDLTDAEARTYLGKATSGSHLLVTITDSGVGIKPEVRRRLFVEPFFTTKVRHRGLGLAIAYRVLCAHRAGIQLDQVPPPGTGTQVRVVLPLAATRAPATTGNSTGRTVPGGTVSTTTVGG
jgi:signal transduction histidine kinase